eukprot:TRINITY_DN76_c0_g1_i1.p1 TRINITY_DN76_c0_g1~~TRINITY_DN76_c0_g1_i1.p1  ORF type:complete len:396 (-),score=79.50 TRINITY_DN76_c0_g1_i1:54-1241(-)
MSNKVTLLAILALLSLCSAQLLPIDPTGCTTGTGCSLSSLVGGALNILLGSVISLDGQSNLRINVDANANFDDFIVSGTNNVVTVASGVALTLKNLTVSTTSSLVINGNTVVNGATTAAGIVTVSTTGSLSGQAYTQTSNNLTVQSSSGASVGTSGSYGAAFTSNLTIGSQAAFTVSPSATVYTAASVTSSGVTTVGGVITVAAGQAYNQANANLQLAQGTITSATASAAGAITVNIQSGASLSGTGNIGASGSNSANLVVSGTGSLNLGNSPGTVFVNGDWRQSATSTFNLELASSTDFDKLIVAGQAYPNGFLKCILISGYTPNNNARHTFVTANGGVSGGFTATTGTTASDLTKWTSQTTNSPATIIATYNSAVSVAVSGLLVVACLLATLL